jgi:Flp pilus assembly protein TadG
MIVSHRSRGHNRNWVRSGIAVAEFAILSPFIAFLVIGMCEMGRAVMVKDILTNASRKGCRTGATAFRVYDDIINDATNILNDNNLKAAKATITVQVAPYTGTSSSPSWGPFVPATDDASFTPGAMDMISVKVSLGVTDVLWFSPFFLPSTAVESETVVMLRQG